MKLLKINQSAKARLENWGKWKGFHRHVTTYLHLKLWFWETLAQLPCQRHFLCLNWIVPKLSRAASLNMPSPGRNKQLSIEHNQVWPVKRNQAFFCPGQLWGQFLAKVTIHMNRTVSIHWHSHPLLYTKLISGRNSSTRNTQNIQISYLPSERDHSFLRNCQMITAVILKNKTEAQTFLLRIHTIQVSLESTIISS